MHYTKTNINSIWADLMIEQLRRCGVEYFTLSPGSRSTPLVAAVARQQGINVSMHVDERGAAFFAVGYARATGRPAAWITTSGTAVANGYPAIIEASQSRLPLIAITADRPAELRDTGANQTIDQVKIFGDYVRWFFDLPVPTEEIKPQMILTTIAGAVYQSLRQPQGPVHLNAMFREPLTPNDDGRDYARYLSPIKQWLESNVPFSFSQPPRSQISSSQVEFLASILNGARRGLIVLGELQHQRQHIAALTLAERLNWPVVADISSGARLGASSPQIMPYADQLLASERFAQVHRPDVVLHFGGAFVSKRLLQFVGRNRQATYILVKEHPFRYDPNHQITHSIEADIEQCCQTLMPMVERSRDTGWFDSWQQASNRAHEDIEQFLNDRNALSEPAIARHISSNIPRQQALFLGNSMPVRDMDMFAAPDGPQVPVSVNRGASGIDGNLASAVGFAVGLRRPTTLLIGDLSLLHDLNSLALARNSAFPITIVVLNNNGGGIFSFLPIARHTDIFEPYFGTPQNVSFEHAARLFNLRYEQPQSMAEFAAAYRTATAGNHATLIEVVTNREENYALHNTLREHIVAALENM
jgi:2-succinyl-5-enolpyruvyl-6-hydroxy-3-cyclohexene-1-carboxylate synthase